LIVFTNTEGGREKKKKEEKEEKRKKKAGFFFPLFSKNVSRPASAGSKRENPLSTLFLAALAGPIFETKNRAIFLERFELVQKTCQVHFSID